MRVTVLAENKAMGAVRCAHGLSLFIETGDRSLLFDFGPDGDLLAENAAALGVDLSRADAAFLSHGHADHAGGLETFLRLNRRAPVYVHPLAFAPHYSRRREGMKDISADASLPERYPGRIVPTGDLYAVDDSITRFTPGAAQEPVPASNASLYVREGEELVPDPFLHEQDMLLREGDTLVLFGGCAHRGILNILRRAEELAGRSPDAVFSGFHLTNPGLGGCEPEDTVRALARRLAALPCLCYTGHCTGEEPFRVLREALGDRVRYMGCGLRFTLPEGRDRV